jgi:hypothetical protein
VPTTSGENSFLPLGQPAKRHKNKIGALFAILLFKATATDRDPSQILTNNILTKYSVATSECLA